MDNVGGESGESDDGINGLGWGSRLGGRFSGVSRWGFGGWVSLAGRDRPHQSNSKSGHEISGFH